MKFHRVSHTENEYRVIPQALEDLWVLSTLIERGDEAEGSSLRRFKVQRGTEGERGESGEKKPVHVRIRVESVEFAESANKLRLTGIILRGTPQEFVQAGEYHTLDVEISRPFTLGKTLSAFHRHMIEEAQEASRQVKAVVVMVDEEKAAGYALSGRGTSLLFEFRNQANKRFPATYNALHAQYYAEILSAILQREDAQAIIIAGPGFEREGLRKYVAEKSPVISKRLSVVHANSSEKSGLNELLKNGLLEQVLGRQKLQEELSALDEFKASLAKSDGLSVYGIDAVSDAVSRGAVRLLMVSDEVLRTSEKASHMLTESKRMGAHILVFNSADDAGAEFSAFGIAALLRYKTYE